MKLILKVIIQVQVILARDYGAEGKFTFTSHMPGEHMICIHSNSTKWSIMAHERLVSIFS